MTASVPVVAFVGRIGSGKSYAAGWLATHHGHTRHSFAAPLKCIASDLFGLPVGLLAGVTDDSRAWRETRHAGLSRQFGRVMTPRRLLQELGTEVFRAWCPDVWVAAARREIETVLAAGGKVVLDDCRFDNEAEMIRAIGGRVVHVDRQGGKGSTRGHASEAGVSFHDGDIPVLNCGTPAFPRRVAASLELYV